MSHKNKTDRNKTPKETSQPHKLAKLNALHGLSNKISSLADVINFSPIDNEDINLPPATISQRLINKTLDKTLQHARDAVTFAADTTEDLIGAVGHATDMTLGALDHVATQTKKGVATVSLRSTNAVKGVVSETSEIARDVALHMARSFLGNTPLTLYLPEVLLNSQIRKRIDRQDIDNITIQCGNNRFDIEIDGHYGRFMYRLSLNFNVLECKIGQEKFLRLYQVDEKLDLQIRHASTLVNWAARRAGQVGFEIVNRLPVITLVNHLIRDIPGIQQEKHRHWYIDLEKAGFIDFINNRSWMVDKLLNLTDFSILPGLNILKESKEWVKQLVDQFEICGLNVQTGRLEIQVNIGSNHKDQVLALLK